MSDEEVADLKASAGSCWAKYTRRLQQDAIKEADTMSDKEVVIPEPSHEFAEDARTYSYETVKGLVTWRDERIARLEALLLTVQEVGIKHMCELKQRAETAEAALKALRENPDAELIEEFNNETNAYKAALKEKDAEIERLKRVAEALNDSALEALELTQEWQNKVQDLELEVTRLLGKLKIAREALRSTLNRLQKDHMGDGMVAQRIEQALAALLAPEEGGQG